MLVLQDQVHHGKKQERQLQARVYTLEYELVQTRARNQKLKVEFKRIYEHYKGNPTRQELSATIDRLRGELREKVEQVAELKDELKMKKQK